MVSLISLAFAINAVAACEDDDLDDLCDTSCDCGGCTESQRTQCFQQSNDARLQAARNDCVGAFDDFVDCVVDNASCDGGSLESGNDACADERSELDACDVCASIAGAPSSVRICQQ
jgi:hypothetical protein